MEGADDQGQGRQALEFGLYRIDSREPLRVHPRGSPVGGSEGDRRKGLVHTAAGQGLLESVLWRGSAPGTGLHLSGVLAATS